jgi:hypothetical protein
MEEMRNAYIILVVRLEGMRPHCRPRRRWEGNIRMNLRETVWEGVDLIPLAQDRDQWWALVNAVMKLRVPLNVGIFLTSLDSQEGLCSMELISYHM